MRAGKIANIQLRINNWFIVLMIFFAFAGMLWKVIAIFSAVLWHEGAHCVCATMLGYPVREVELLPFGGVARISGLTEAGTDKEILMSVAGPIASLVLAAIVFLTINYTNFSNYFLQFYLKVNLLLAFFNLLPALPLDGGRIFRAGLSKLVSYHQATHIVVYLSKIIGGALFLWAVKDFWQWRTINFTWVIASIFIVSGAQREIQVAGFRNIRMVMQKKTQLLQQGVMPVAQFSTLKLTPVRDILRVLGPERYHIIVVIDEKFHLQGFITETELWEAVIAKGLYVKIKDLL